MNNEEIKFTWVISQYFIESILLIIKFTPSLFVIFSAAYLIKMFFNSIFRVYPLGTWAEVGNLLRLGIELCLAGIVASIFLFIVAEFIKDNAINLFEVVLLLLLVIFLYTSYLMRLKRNKKDASVKED